MQPTQVIKSELQFLSNIIGDFNIKTYFSYYGLFQDGLMFALYKNQKLYLRAAQSCLTDITKTQGTHILTDTQMGLHTKKFYLIPTELISKNTPFELWMQAILQELQQAKAQQNEKSKTQIRSLPNMNIKLERVLKKLDIHSVDELTQQGDIATFVKLVEKGFEGSDLLLFKLHGAIAHKYVCTFTQAQKVALLQEANLALYKAGLRKRFQINS